MSYVRNWLHCVWGTKNRFPFLTGENKQAIIEHILQNAREKSISIDCINGATEHLHCLINLHPDQSLAKVMQLIKGESSFWLNKSGIIQSRFEWADEYFAVSVSMSHIQRVRGYIARQEQHHRKRTWLDEYDEFVSLYGFERIKG